MERQDTELSRWVWQLRVASLCPRFISEYFGDYLGEGMGQVIEATYRGDSPRSPGYFTRRAVSRLVAHDAGRRKVMSTFHSELRDAIGGQETLAPFPSDPDATASWEEFAAHCGYKSVWQAKHDDLHRPLSKDERARQRFLYNNTDLVEYFGPRFGQGLALLLRTVETSHGALVREWVIDPIVAAGPRAFKSEAALRRMLKRVGSLAKVHGDAVPGWKGLVGLEVLGGYVAAPPADDFLDDVVQWVSGPGPDVHAVPGWFGAYRRAAAQFVRGVRPGSPPLSFSEYIAQMDWCRPGSSDVPSDVQVVVDGEIVSVRDTKDLLGFALTHEEIMRIALDPQPKPARAMVKREAGKARAVLVSDLSLYLKMAWLSTYLEPAMRRIEGTSLFFDASDQAAMWERLGRDSRDSSLWKLPLDQSKFDHNITLEMIEVVFDVMSTMVVGDEAERVLAQVRHALVVAPSVVVVGSHTVRIEKGVLSGWRWTALLDTWINFSQCYGSLLWLESIGIPVDLNKEGLFCQGDDVRYCHPNPGVCVALCEVMRRVGFDINPSKTWLSPTRDEFLRQVAVDGLVCGYAARAITSIQWRNPIRIEPRDPVGLVGMTVNQWLVLCSRGCPPARVRALATSQVVRLARRFGVDPQHLTSYITAPASIRGAVGCPAELLGPRGVVAGGVVAKSYPIFRYREVMKHVVMRGLRGLRVMAEGVASRFGVSEVVEVITSHAAKVVQPHTEAALVDREASGGVIEWVDRPAIAVPPSPPAYATPPVRAAVDKGGYPLWAAQAALVCLANQRRYDDVDAHLVGSSREYSRSIRVTHGKRTWLEWITGALSVPIKTWVGWSPAYIGARFKQTANRYLRRCLASARPFRGKYRDALVETFYQSQLPPFRVGEVTVGM